MTAAVTAMVAVATTLPFSTANAQERFAEPSRTEANHSVSIDLIGIHYAYEHPLGRTATIVGRAGANFGFAWSGSWRSGTMYYYGSYWEVKPTVEIEPRWYYGLDRREWRGRSTDGNAGSYLSLNVSNVFPGYNSNDFKMWGYTTFAPTWGMRRVWSSGLMLEFSTGYRFGFYHDPATTPIFDDEDFLNHIDLNLRFGFKF